MEKAEDQMMQFPEILKIVDEIILQKLQETIKEFEIKLNDKINKLKK
jgi:hypothetical protein